VNGEILAIGDEITSGQLLDTNSQWLSQRLEELGVRVHYHATVGDELEPIADAFRQAIGRADVVLATGGLGPTADDLTRDALARAADRPLVLDPSSLEHIRRLFARRGRPMPSQNEIQAMFPAGSRAIPNPHGTAPGIALAVPRQGRPPCRIYCFPGVPAEMRQMWQETVAGWIGSGEQTRAGPDVGRITNPSHNAAEPLDGLTIRPTGRRTIQHRKIKCFGAGESQIESMLPDLIRRGRIPRVGINASQATIILRITAEGDSPDACRQSIEPTAQLIYRSLGSLVFGEGDDELQHAVVGLLRRRRMTLASMEWGTAGLLAELLGGVEGAGDVYRGGSVATSAEALARLVRLPPGLDPAVEAQAEPLVRAMAAACRESLAADLALAVGPAPRFDPLAAEPKPIYFALAGPSGVRVKSTPYAAHPGLLRILSAKHAMNLVRLALLDDSPSPFGRASG
jgi:nicotinamide-nucleotide amidase